MSMPTFPSTGLDLTKEQVFNMLLGSIAMEEIALSHMMNAEGEKLQYILGTLPGSRQACPSTNEVLQVNDSIANMLEHIGQIQLMLKGKMAQVIEVMKIYEPCPPKKKQMSCSVFNAPSKVFWQKEHHMPWQPAYCNSEKICWNKDCKENIYLPNNKPVLLNFSFKICNEESGATVAIQTCKNGKWQNIENCEFCCCENIISSSVVLHPNSCFPTPSPIAFALIDPCKVIAEHAKLSIIEL